MKLKTVHLLIGSNELRAKQPCNLSTLPTSLTHVILAKLNNAVLRNIYVHTLLLL